MVDFAAVVCRDGQPVDAPGLERVAAALKPVGAASAPPWRDAAAGLVAIPDRRFTPEAALDSQPASAGNCVLLFNGLLAHREELIAALALPRRRAAQLADSALFASAWERWGADAALRAEGRFAAVVWDPRAGVLSAVCSPLEAPPLYYAIDRRRALLATAPRGIFAYGDLERRFDDAILASNMVNDWGDGRATCYRGVRSLLPGEALTVSAQAARTRRYYDLAEHVRPIRLAADADYVDAADDLLRGAVASAMRTAAPPAISLSGGLDSSALAVTALDFIAGRTGATRLASFTITNAPGWDGRAKDGVLADESQRVRALARMYPALHARFLHAGGVDTEHMLRLHGRIIELAELPMQGILSFRQGTELVRLAAEAGHDVLLDGAYGNNTLSYNGFALLASLFRSGRVPSLLREAAGAPRGRRLGRFSPVLHYGVYRNLPRRLHGWVRRIVYGQRGWRDIRAIHPRFARTMRVDERGRASGVDHYFRGCTNVWDALSRRWEFGERNQFGRAAPSFTEALHGVQMRSPFGERRLVEWCLGVPVEQYMRDGKSRRLLRRMMKDRLPLETLSGARGRAGQDWHLHATRDLPEIRATFERWRKDPGVSERVDLDRALRLVNAWPQRTPVSRRDHPEFLFIRYGIDQALALGRFIRWVEGGGNWGAT